MADNWQIPCSFPLLEAQTIHIWRVLVSAWKAPEGIDPFATLSEDEQSRAKRLRIEAKRWQYVVGRFVLRTLLGQYLQIAPQAVEFSYGEQGKPELRQKSQAPGKRPISFNLSHSEDALVYAFATEGRLGVDVEYMQPERGNEAIARRFFSECEVGALLSLAAPERLTAFYQCWTGKEAVVKAIGEGLSMPLNSFDVALPPQPPGLLSIRVAGEHPKHWTLQSIDVAPGYQGTCAADGNQRNWHYWDYDASSFSG
jgi:4'-phosphopantetheinyl transferase